jgi:hypothetical protein
MSRDPGVPHNLCAAMSELPTLTPQKAILDRGLNDRWSK